MLEKILSAYVSETLQIPIWTIVLATVCLLWLLHNGRKQVNTKVCYRIYTSPKSNRRHHGLDRMIVGFTTTYSIIAYRH
jgi:hypothetical protein